MPTHLYDPERDSEAAKSVPPAVRVAIVHSFFTEIQKYTEEMLQQKWEATIKVKGRDPELLQKLSNWLIYHRFNQLTLKEIEDGTLDDWFRRLF